TEVEGDRAGSGVQGVPSSSFPLVATPAERPIHPNRISYRIPNTTNMAYTNVCGKKLRAKMGGVLNESAASHSPALLSSHQSFAKRQLEKMGWTEGTGLGKRRDGVKDHVKIRQREDEVGLGREKEAAKEASNAWWKDCAGGTLARLQQQQKKKSGKEKKSSKREKDGRKDKAKSERESTATVKTFTDEELFAATGGARFGMRAQRRAEGKWKRTESGSEHSELERKAKESMEWNGRGSAQVVVKGDTGEKRSRPVESGSEEECHANLDATDGQGSRSKKKRRKLERELENPHKISPPASEEEEEASKVDKPDDKKKKKKRKKEEKKAKKSKKKGKQ
ncbi:hypothetical protein ACHAWF_002900, partial [Thalassiosira exigua]